MRGNHPSTRWTRLARVTVVGMASVAGLVVAAQAMAGQLDGGVVRARPGQPVAVAAAPQAAPRIEIGEHSFSRPTLTVPVGTTVTWVNRDEDVHTVVSTTEAFASRGLETDDSYSFTFTKPGVYPYFCTLHPMMTGKVVVN